MSENLTAISYLISAIFFILALKGLSHPESARNGNIMGIIGMTIAIITTLFNPNVLSYEMIIIGISAQCREHVDTYGHVTSVKLE